MTDLATAKASENDLLAVLLDAVSSGCHSSFERLHEIMHRRVHAVTMQVLRSREHADEAAQETFAHIWLQADRFDPVRGSASSWMFSIARRRAVDQVRISMRESAVRQRFRTHCEIESDDPYDDLLNRLDAYRVASVLEHLTPLQREVLDMRYVRGRSVPEVAAELRIPLGTAKTRIRDGLCRLRVAVMESDSELAGLGRDLSGHHDFRRRS